MIKIRSNEGCCFLIYNSFFRRLLSPSFQHHHEGRNVCCLMSLPLSTLTRTKGSVTQRTNNIVNFHVLSVHIYFSSDDEKDEKEKYNFNLILFCCKLNFWPVTQTYLKSAGSDLTPTPASLAVWALSSSAVKRQWRR